MHPCTHVAFSDCHHSPQHWGPRLFRLPGQLPHQGPGLGGSQGSDPSLGPVKSEQAPQEQMSPIAYCLVTLFPYL